MKEIPMLMSTDMVVATLEDRKLMTRRMRGLHEINKRPDAFRYDGVNSESEHMFFDIHGQITGHDPQDCIVRIKSPYGSIGDLIWVRETWDAPGAFGVNGRKIFKADKVTHPYGGRWKPSIHMPKVAARIWLEITGIRIERLQDITEEDALKEGVKSTAVVNESGDDYTGFYASENFITLWECINGKLSWSTNPWVWVISFKVLSKTGRP